MILYPLKKLVKKTGYTVIKTSFLEKQYIRVSNPEYRRSGDLNPLEQLFYRYVNDGFFFVQIGANDGKRHDPIHHLLVREKELVSGIAIEPVKEYFNDLVQTYSDFSNIKLLNIAIHNEKKEEIIYKINPDAAGIPDHFKGMSSFDISNFTKDGISEDQILSEKVSCLSFMDLIAVENIQRIHLLQIDAEGYDIDIINSIDFTKVKPLVINFEHRWEYNLVSENVLFGVFRKLLGLGYHVSLNGNDAIAYLTETND